MLEKNAVVALSRSPVKRVREFVSARGKAHLKDIVEALDLPYSTASSSVSQLEHAGLVTKRREDRRLVVAISCAGSAASLQTFAGEA